MPNLLFFGSHQVVEKYNKKDHNGNMKRFILTFLFLLLFAILLPGCAHVVSKESRDKVDMGISPIDVLKDPDMYKGKFVILGGIIASSINTEEGTYIEMVQKPLDYRGRPEDTDILLGRFLILYEDYLDTAIYSRGREVTVVGEVVGKRIRPPRIDSLSLSADKKQRDIFV